MLSDIVRDLAIRFQSRRRNTLNGYREMPLQICTLRNAVAQLEIMYPVAFQNLYSQRGALYVLL